jgi:hypothetical protein
MDLTLALQIWRRRATSVVVQGEQHIARRRDIVARLERDGHDSLVAREMLAQIEGLLARYTACAWRRCWRAVFFRATPNIAKHSLYQSAAKITAAFDDGRITLEMVPAVAEAIAKNLAAIIGCTTSYPNRLRGERRQRRARRMASAVRSGSCDGIVAEESMGTLILPRLSDITNSCAVTLPRLNSRTSQLTGLL